MRHASLVAASGSLPEQVLTLAPRERQIATFIYFSGHGTAKDVEDHLSGAISNSAIRSMLSRLATKGILKRRKRVTRTSDKARRIAFVYLPAIDDVAVRQRAIAQVAVDYFNGSLVRLAETADLLAARERTGGL